MPCRIRYYLKSFKVDEGTMIQTAILQSGILQQFTEIDLRENKVGIYSRPAKLNDQLKDGDRIEIYRPLLADPKEIRRKRAAEQAKAAQEKPNKKNRKGVKMTALSNQYCLPMALPLKFSCVIIGRKTIDYSWICSEIVGQLSPTILSN